MRPDKRKRRPIGRIMATAIAIAQKVATSKNNGFKYRKRKEDMMLRGGMEEGSYSWQF